MNGDEIRDVRFRRRPYGYDALQVEDLLGRLAAEVDAGRLIGSLLANATFRRTGLRRRGLGYDREPVDWFLVQLRPTEDRAGSCADPWRHLAVADYFAGSGPGLDQECADAWRDFGQVPGTQLRWGWAGLMRRELHTTEQNTIAYRRGTGTGTFSTGHRSFTVKTVTGSSRPSVAAIADRYARDYDGHFRDPDTPKSRLRRDRFKAAEYRDEAGRPVLYASGRHINRRARGSVTFPDQRWLRFPVRSTSRQDAIMTAVDQDGNKVARYRVTGRLWGPGWRSRCIPIGS